MICTYLSVKDGCGSTTALLHTAQILSRRFLKKVCVIDFDTNYTGEHQKLLEQKESLTLRQYFESEFSQSPPLHHSGVAQLLFHQEGENFLSQKEIIVVLEELQKKYDVLLIDMGSQPNPFHFSSLLLSQYIFLFCQAQSFLYEKALEKKKRLLCSHIPEKRIKLICNFWENHLDLIKKEESIFTLPAERKAPFNLQNYIGDYTVKIEKMIDIFFLKETPKIKVEDFDSYPYPDFLLPAYLEASSGKKELKNFSSEKVNPIDQDIKRKILQKLLTKLNFKELSLSQKNVEKLKEKTRQEVYLIFNEFDLSPLQKEKILQEVLDEVLGLGPLESFLKDEEISEIMINGPDQIYIEKKGQIHFSPRSFHSEEQVRSIIERIVAPLGKRVDESSPLVDARLPDGSRVNVILPPLSLKGPIVTIRRFSHKLLTAQNLIEKESLNSAMADFLKAAIQARLNLIVSGGTGSGKTTLLNILSSFIPDEQRIITIEDAAELKLSQSHVIPLESRPPNIEGKGEIPIRILLKNSLRMRPDRIIIGECRGEESLDMLQAMNTGHDGSLTTIHANSPRDCISRLETLVLFSGYKLSTKAIRSQIASAIDLIVQISRFSDGSRKLSQITEITGIEGETISQQDIFYFDQQGVGPDKKVIGRHRATGAIPRFIESLEKKGIPFSMDFFREDL